MAQEADRGRPVQITSPGYRTDQTNDLRMDRDALQRLIARYLRETMNPGQANDLSNRIIDGVVAAQKASGRAALRDWRMIPLYPPDDIREQIARDFRSIRVNHEDNMLS